MTKKKTAAEIIRDPVSAKRTHRQRVKYLNMPEVRRAMAIERAEKQQPISDESGKGKLYKSAKARFESLRDGKKN